MWLIKHWNSSTIGGEEYTLLDEAGLRVMVNNDEDVTSACYSNNINSIFIDSTEFNQDIGSWNTSNMTNMGYVFQASNAFNQNTGNWDTSNLTNIIDMFAEAFAFNQN